MNKPSVYRELMYGEQRDGSCNWTGRLYYRKEPGVAVITEGFSEDRETARKDFQLWVDTQSDLYDIQ